jgi:hypothetical protein
MAEPAKTNVKGLFMMIMLPVLFDLFGTFENDAVGFQPVLDHSVVLQEIFTHI